MIYVFLLLSYVAAPFNVFVSIIQLRSRSIKCMCFYYSTTLQLRSMCMFLLSYYLENP